MTKTFFYLLRKVFLIAFLFFLFRCYFTAQNYRFNPGVDYFASIGTLTGKEIYREIEGIFTHGLIIPDRLHSGITVASKGKLK